MSKNLKKNQKKKIDYYKQQNKTLYIRWKTAQETLDTYEQTVAGQITALTSRYEAIVCYLIRKLGWDGVCEAFVADWAKDKEYALVAKMDEDDGVIWTPVVRVIEGGEDDGEQQTLS